MSQEECEHLDWSDDSPCACGSEMARCLVCGVALFEIEQEEAEAARDRLTASLQGKLEAWRIVAMEWDAWYKSGMQGMIPYESVKAARELEGS